MHKIIIFFFLTYPVINLLRQGNATVPGTIFSLLCVRPTTCWRCTTIKMGLITPIFLKKIAAFRPISNYDKMRDAKCLAPFLNNITTFTCYTLGGTWANNQKLDNKSY